MSDLVNRAKEEFEKDRRYWEPIYTAAREDLYFLSDNDDAQWTEFDLKNRKRSGRPALTIDQLGQYVNQVVNDIRKNTPSIDVIPGTDGDVEVAEVQQNLIRNILYRSDADTAFDIAASYAVKGSIGFIRVDTEYADEKSFDQELKICAVEDPFTCYLDRDSKDVTGKDAKHCFVLDSISKEAFEERFPNKEPISFTQDNYITNNEGDIIIAEFFDTKIKKKKIGLTIDGILEEVQEEFEYVQEREVEEVTIKRYLLSGEDVLERSEFVGGFIPVIPVLGNQSWVNGDREISSLIRRSKDAQRMFNFWKSLETELLQKQPRATFMHAAGQIEDFAGQWADPDKSPTLTYKPTDIAGNQVPPPIRLDPPPIPAGVVQASRSAVDDIKSTIGMYAASIGQESNEVSGVAIQRRNEEGETATYHFSDNLSKSIAQLGKLLVNAIPKIYDTARYIRVIDKEEEAKVIGINGAIAVGQENPIHFRDEGYDVKVVTGASYTTQRQEAAEFFNTVVIRNPELMTVMGDLLFKNMDFAGAQAMADRMKKYIDPKFSDEEEVQFDPEKEEMSNVIEQGQYLIGQLEAQIEDLTDELKSKEAELVIKAQSEENKKKDNEESNQIDILKLAADQEKAEKEYEFKMAALDLKRQELLIKAAEKQTDIDIKVEQHNERPQSVDLNLENTTQPNGED